MCLEILLTKKEFFTLWQNKDDIQTKDKYRDLVQKAGIEDIKEYLYTHHIPIVYSTFMDMVKKGKYYELIPVPVMYDEEHMFWTSVAPLGEKVFDARPERCSQDIDRVNENNSPFMFDGYQGVVASCGIVFNVDDERLAFVNLKGICKSIIREKNNIHNVGRVEDLAFPGGGIEVSDDRVECAVDAACRETFEETGIDVRDIIQLAISSMSVHQKSNITTIATNAFRNTPVGNTTFSGDLAPKHYVSSASKIQNAECFGPF